jgi:hypothetical protein
MASLGAVLEQYPNDVIVYVTDPRTGIQRGCKWPPSIAEIVEACDKRVEELHHKQRFSTWGKRNEPALPPPDVLKPTYEQLKEKYGEDFGLSPRGPRPAPEPAPSWKEIVQTYSADPSRIRRLLGAAEDQHPLPVERNDGAAE